MALNASQLGVSVPNWQLVASNAPTGVGTYTFPGLAGYSKYRILAPKLTAVGVASLSLQLNGDSGANYSGALPATAGAASTSISLSNGANTSNAIYAEIDSALILAPKLISIPTTATGQPLQFFAYLTASLLTSITINISANFSTGTIYLLGAN